VVDDPDLDAGGDAAVRDGAARDSAPRDAASDAAVLDAALDAKDSGEGGKVHAGSADSGTSDAAVGVPLVCPPANMSGFSPTWHAPRPQHANACTAAQVDLLIGCLTDTVLTQDQCAPLLKAAANQTCMGCLKTMDTSATYGALVESKSLNVPLMRINEPGCIAYAEGDLTALGCGAAVQAWHQCLTAACEPVCPIVSSDIDDRVACEAAASAGACATYAANAACRTAYDQAPSAPCFIGASVTGWADAAKRIGKQFCMP
jgi:hypothetical protein